MNDFDLYLEKYCDLYKITKEEGLRHALVKEVKKFYKDNEGRFSTYPNDIYHNFV